MIRRKCFSFAIFAAAAMALGVGTNARSQSEIALLAPRPMQPTIDKIVAQFQAKTGQNVKVTYQAAKLIRQLVSKGEPLDVSLIAAPFPGAIASGTIIPASATPVAGFLTAVAVPKGALKPDISTPAAVKKALLAAASVGYEDPEFTIDGEAPAQVIDKLGIADRIAAKIKVCAGAASPYSPNSVCYDASGSPGPRRSTLTQDCAPNSNCFTAPPPGSGGSVFSIQKQLSRGQVGIAMLFLSDMLPNKDRYDIVGLLPRKISAPIMVVGFIATRASNPESAKALLQYMASPEAQAMFKTDGYEPHN
jgi:ABC-type molybdate transport system substrate-binding protein